MMSLKGFHLFFISVSTILTAGFAVWCVWWFVASKDYSLLALAVLSAAGTFALVVYGLKVRKKLQMLTTTP